MKLREIYNLALEVGMEFDPRGKEHLQKILKNAADKFNESKPEERFEYDKEKMINPYDGTRILYEGTKKDLKRVMAGIKIGSAEIILAKILKNIDAIICHHSLVGNLSAIDTAKLLDIPLFCLPEPANSLAGHFMQNKLFKKIPEYHEAAKMGLKRRIIAFESLGLNLFLDKIEAQDIKIVPCSGLIRVKRITANNLLINH